ncbi:PAS domain S-box protein [Uliginosibacterium paludis]|uniref:histidine kinase n=1 Tax=Uliginosibacterium paludis TaxID=1615952 RepID=A0ABV2CR87_9RHOO
MGTKDESRRLAVRWPKSFSSALSVLLLIVAPAVAWLATGGSNAPGDSDRLRLFIIALITIAGWGLIIAKQQRQRAGRIEEERDLFFTLSLDIFCTMNPAGLFERINPAVLNILGRKPDALTEGVSLPEIVHPDDAGAVRQSLAELGQGRPAQFEARCRCGDGSWRWLSWSATPRVEEKRIYAVAHDITNRKSREETLRADSDFRKAMEDSVLTGLQAVSPDGRILYVNKAFSELVGWGGAELIGQMPPYVFWDENEREENWQRMRENMVHGAKTEGVELAVRRRDGRPMDVRQHVSPLVNSQGEQTGWMIAMTDITEQRRARAELQAANERITTVLDGLDAAVYVAEAASGDLLYSNRAYDSQHLRAGTTSRDAIPERELGDYPVDPRRLRSADVPRELFDGELQHPVTAQWFHIRERALRWVDGRIVRLVVATDITALKRAEELNREQEERLARTSRLITMGEMASTLAHELNQPLSAISNYSMGCVNRLKSGQFRLEDIVGAMEKASVQANRAGNIVRRIREFVRKSEPRRSIISLSQVTEEALGIAEIEARRLGTRIVTHLPDDLPPVLADRIMIEQVLMNLVKNAAEAMQDKPLDERVIHIDACEKHNSIEVSVTDRGSGISAEHLDELFSPFFTTKKEGMGMGLNICRSIIEFHKGRLWVDANPEGGCIFRFTLALENKLESDHDNN